ncbi:hypothetical protein L596_029045 [Steinernema carpocapsae]|uniref:Phlebovirus glycoprotein G2 fusion domain-containing protein n=1 Tax=Steinernema carpocapsae TaxID=34508 RepID=A0A4U5LTG7_STECR|nr:hypothetical protein L596_029045 [Steinernema carpocapsae]
MESRGFRFLLYWTLLASSSAHSVSYSTSTYELYYDITWFDTTFNGQPSYNVTYTNLGPLSYTGHVTITDYQRTLNLTVETLRDSVKSPFTSTVTESFGDIVLTRSFFQDGTSTVKEADCGGLMSMDQCVTGSCHSGVLCLCASGSECEENPSIPKTTTKSTTITASTTSTILPPTVQKSTVKILSTTTLIASSSTIPKSSNVTNGFNYPDANPCLKLVLDGPITSKNVNETLAKSLGCAKSGGYLTPGDITVLSLILQNASMLPKLTRSRESALPYLNLRFLKTRELLTL